jgi:hypothetical protein
LLGNGDVVDPLGVSDGDGLLDVVDEVGDGDESAFFVLPSLLQPASVTAHISMTTGIVRRRCMVFPRESRRSADVGCQL